MANLNCFGLSAEWWSILRFGIESNPVTAASMLLAGVYATWGSEYPAIFHRPDRPGAIIARAPAMTVSAQPGSGRFVTICERAGLTSLPLSAGTGHWSLTGLPVVSDCNQLVTRDAAKL